MESKKFRTSQSLRREHRNAGANVQRVFMGWERPLLHSAISHMLRRYVKGQRWEMDHVLVVLPSSLAARRLQQLMAVTASDQALLLRPPQVLTFGDLPEKLYKAKFPFASPLQQSFAWIDALRSFTSEELSPLLVQTPAADVIQPWMELASMLSGLHRELSSDLTMFSDVIELLTDDRDEARWRVLSELQSRYLDRLTKQQLWDIQTARRFAISKNEVSLAAGQEVVMLGTVDLNRAQRYFIDLIGSSVTVLIGAPETWSEGFDNYGALDSDFWQDVCVEIPPEALISRSTTSEVAESLASFVGQFSMGYGPQEITIGVPEPEVLAPLMERLDRSDVRTRLVAGVAATQTSPLRLMKMACEFITSGRYEDFAALVRVPRVEKLLRRDPTIPEDFLAKLDEYYQTTLIHSVRVADVPNKDAASVFLQVLSALDQWLKPLQMDRAELQRWASSFRQILSTIIGDWQVDLEDSRDSAEFQAVALLSSVLTQLEDLPQDVSFQVTLNEAFGWVSRELESERIAPVTDAQSIDLLGWLELCLDDAPVLLLTGVHDGRVPESVNSDAFLPNTIRTRLGLLDNDRRYARDCYYLQVILHSREHLRILTNHYNAEGSPQTPSRLLLAVQPDDLAPRIMSLLKPSTDDATLPLMKNWRPFAGQSQIPIPLPNSDLGKTLTSFSATDLADYLYCPYRFYLKKICKTRSIDDDVLELEANKFGDLIHNCVSTLKGSPVQQSTSAEEIRKWLFQRLREDADRQFGKIKAPAVHVQVEQARLRLAKFAELQAARNEAGWVIQETEVDVTRQMKVSMVVDGDEVTFHGRIDRIDFHPATNRYAIWDYKTSDSPKKPEKAHFDGKRWRQLQLPLYRHLVTGLALEPRVNFENIAGVGYINLPKAIDQVAFEEAKFSSPQLLEAEKEIRRVVGAIRKGIFWPPNYDDVFATDEFLAITQHHAARRWTPAAKTVEHLEEGHTLKSPTSNLAVTNESKETKVESKVLVDPELSSQLVSAPRRAVTKLPRSTQRKSDLPDRITPLLDNTTGKVPSSWYSSKLIRASAGSGKTYQLAKRVIQLLFANESVDSILATTFTRKAAGEILERVLTLIAKAVIHKSDFEALRSMVEPRVITVQSCKYHLARLCSDLHRLRISTLDSFYNELARNFSLELNLPPGWRLADPYEERALQAQAISRMFFAIEQDQIQSLISQLCKGEAVRGVWREIATTVDAAYSIYLASPRHAWMQKFVTVVPSEDDILLAKSAIGASRCADSRYEAAKTKLLEVFESKDYPSFLKSSLVNAANKGELTYYKKPIEPDVSASMLLLATVALASEFAVLEQQNSSAYELLANYHTQLENVKRRDRVLTFADVSLRLSAWMQKRLEATAERQRAIESDDRMDLIPIHQRLDSRIKHLLLDEFQDTSPAQWKILQPFAMDVYVSDSSKSKSTSIFCVGDVKQAIYGWRGGVAELFEIIARQLTGIQDDFLKKSYRSSPVIIQFVNDTFGRLDAHEKYGQGAAAIAFWISRFEQHEFQHATLPGYVQIYNGSKKTARSVEGDQDDDEVDTDLFDRCVADIRALHNAAPKKSIAVLVRTNGEVSHVINLLREQGIDASQEGGNPLTDSSPVDLLLSLISLADHPGDGVAYFHITSSAPAAFLELLPAEHNPAILSTWVREQIDGDGYADTISRFAARIATACNPRDQLRLEQLIQLAYRYEQLEAVRLRDFIEYVKTQKISLPKPAAVRVMTVHQSKGLEFDAVFLPNLSRQFVSRQSTFVVKVADVTSIPDGVTRRVGGHLESFLSDDWRQAFEKDATSQLQESLCNFYVAITRARQALYVYTTPNKNAVQQWGSVLQSIFNPEARENEDCVIYESGNCHWYEDIDRKPGWSQTLFSMEDDAEIAADSVVIGLNEDFLSEPKPKKLRYLPGLRPSTIAHQERKVELQRALAPAVTIGTVVGTVVHRWFEDIEWIDGYAFDPSRAKQQALDVLSPEQMPLIDIDEWIAKFAGYLENPGVREVLSREQYQIEKLRAMTARDLDLTIRNESRLLEYVDGMLLRGTIDRLVLVEDGSHAVAAEIIDYKTDFFEPFQPGSQVEAWVESKKLRHGQQLRMYRDAISRMYQLPKERITMTLMLLSADLVVSIDD